MTIRGPLNRVAKLCRLSLALAVITVPGAGSSTATQGSACDIGLVLALDVSGSVSQKEFRLQTEGIAEAFEDSELIQLLTFYDDGVMVSVMQWASEDFQKLSVDWTVINTPEDAHALAEKIRTIERGAADLTATGSALNYAQALFGETPADCDRKVIDVSTDGLSNRGPDMGRTADAVASTGTVINALVIYGESPSLVRYFERNLVRGAGSFSHSIAEYADYPDAIKRKLLRELRPDVSINMNSGRSVSTN